MGKFPLIAAVEFAKWLAFGTAIFIFLLKSHFIFKRLWHSFSLAAFVLPSLLWNNHINSISGVVESIPYSANTKKHYHWMEELCVCTDKYYSGLGLSEKVYERYCINNYNNTAFNMYLKEAGGYAENVIYDEIIELE